MIRSNRHFYALSLFVVVLGAALQRSHADPDSGNPASGAAFFKVDFPNVHSNGRGCATCHVPEEAFQLTPQHVEARFQALEERRLTNPLADDPLFRAIDANDFAEENFESAEARASSRPESNYRRMLTA